MLAANWIPSNPVKTLFPFYMTLLHDEKIQKERIEIISNKFKIKYGFDISFFAINKINKLAFDLGIVTELNDPIIVDLEKIDSKYLISETSSNKIVDNIELLLAEFIIFCKEDEIDHNIAESTLTKFLQRYDLDLLLEDKEIVNNENDVYLYFFVEFVKYIFKINKRLYKILIEICEGNMIRSQILNEDIDISCIYKNQQVYLDTPVVLKLLGYYGEYIKNEYCFLVKSWFKQGAYVNIFEHTLIEIENIFFVASRWVDNVEIDLSRSSQVTTYFREKGYSSIEVLEESNTIQSRLFDLGISVISIKYEEFAMFYENQDLIKQKIVEVYKLDSYSKYDIDNDYSDYIDYDVKSIFNTYLILKGQFPTKMVELKAIFVTTNTGIIRAVRNYHNEKYGQTIAPVLKDTFIGLIIVANNSSDRKEFINTSLIAYCQSAYKPSSQTKRVFINKVTELKDRREIDDKEYTLLKNTNEGIELIAEHTQGMNKEITDETVFTILAKIKERLIEDETKRLKDGYEKTKKENETEKEREKEKYEIEIKAEKGIRINLAKNEMKKRITWLYIWNFFTIIVFAGAALLNLLFSTMSKLINVNYGTIDIICTIILCVIPLINVYDMYKGNKRINGKILKMKAKVANKFMISVSDMR